MTGNSYLAVCVCIHEAEWSGTWVRQTNKGEGEVDRILDDTGRSTSPQPANLQPQKFFQGMRETRTGRRISQSPPWRSGLADEERPRQEGASGQNHRAGMDFTTSMSYHRQNLVKT